MPGFVRLMEGEGADVPVALPILPDLEVCWEGQTFV